jgi:F-type H+-transporting ATPase subunit b
MINAEFWVAVAFVLFVALLIYMGVHRMLLDALDQRSARIKAELDEALRLKDEAQKLLAAYQTKHSEAEREAEAIIGSAKIEAERIAAEAKTKMEDFLARRSKMAEMKIAQAEAQAVAEVRAAAAEAAVSAAERILTESTKGKAADDLVAQGIRDVKAKLN